MFLWIIWAKSNDPTLSEVYLFITNVNREDAILLSTCICADPPCLSLSRVPHSEDQTDLVLLEIQQRCISKRLLIETLLLKRFFRVDFKLITANLHP